MLKIGHRGAGGDVPENTLKSFATAIESGANAVELDVRKTKDGKLVIFHNEKVDKLLGTKGYVSDFTLAQIKQFDIQGERIPTLDEALDFIDRKVEKILVEIKEPGTEKAILEKIKERKLEDHVIIISFHEDALRFTHTKDIERAHENGFKVIVWTINTKEEMEEFKNKGVDGIATDYPSILSSLK